MQLNIADTKEHTLPTSHVLGRALSCKDGAWHPQPCYTSHALASLVGTTLPNVNPQSSTTSKPTRGIAACPAKCPRWSFQVSRDAAAKLQEELNLQPLLKTTYLAPGKRPRWSVQLLVLTAPGGAMQFYADNSICARARAAAGVHPDLVELQSSISGREQSALQAIG